MSPAPARRSWWGWGTEADQPSPAEVTEVVRRVAQLLPEHDFTDHPPPAPADLAVGTPRLEPPSTLRRLFGDDVPDRLSHARGKAFRDVVRNLTGDVRHVPDLVARPRTEHDVVDILDWCTATGTPVIPYGGGSSVVGGVEPRFDGPAVTLDLELLDRVLEIDRTSRAARIQAGIYGPALEEQLRSDDLTLRHYPQSFGFSTLGGWLATRAGGHFATLYTHIDDLTESLRVVTPVGVSESRRLPASGAGPSPDGLFLGSEGTLGIITEAWMRLQRRPVWQESSTVAFADHASAVTATRVIAQSGLHPANCRLLDAAEAFIHAGVTVGGLLLLAFESADHPVDAWLDRARAIALDHGGRSLTPAAADAREDASTTWRSAFLRMPYQRDALARRSMVVETFETACTWDRYDALHDAVRGTAHAAVADACGGQGMVTSRFTHVYPDGPAPYYTVYASGTWGSQVAQWDDIKAAVSDAIVQRGGTITHHHAVGRDHRPWYDRQRPAPYAAALAAAKVALDPAGILNPGVLLPLPVSEPGSGVKS
jgi:alkyldihydroxyacetonephosphate synthase